MQKRKFIRLLKEFDSKSLSKFRLFVIKNSSGSDKSLLVILDFVSNFHPKFDSPSFIEENATKQLKALGVLSSTGNSKLNKIFSQLFTLLENFITSRVIASAKDKDLRKSVQLLKFYNTKNANLLFKQRAKIFLAEFHNLSHENNEKYHLKYQFEKEIAFLKGKNDNRIGDINLENAVSALDEYYFLEKCATLCLMLNRSKVLGVHYKLDFIDEVKKLPSPQLFPDNPKIQMWNASLQLLLSSSKEYFYTLKNLLSTNANDIPELELRALFGTLENESKNLVWNSSIEFYQVIFELYEAQLERQLLYIKGYLLPHTFKNIITVAIRLNKTKWVENFLQSNKNRIQPPHQNEVYNFNLAQLLFHKKQFELTLAQISTINPTDLFYLLGLKKIQAKSYFALNEYGLLENFLGTFRVFVHRKKNEMSEFQFQAHQNFINILSRLTVLSQSPFEINSKKYQLIEKTHSFSAISEKEWLLEQLNDL